MKLVIQHGRAAKCMPFWYDEMRSSSRILHVRWDTRWASQAMIDAAHRAGPVPASLTTRQWRLCNSEETTTHQGKRQVLFVAARRWSPGWGRQICRRHLHVEEEVASNISSSLAASLNSLGAAVAAGRPNPGADTRPPCGWKSLARRSASLTLVMLWETWTAGDSNIPFSPHTGSSTAGSFANIVMTTSPWAAPPESSRRELRPKPGRLSYQATGSKRQFMTGIEQAASDRAAKLNEA
jgi:hypothetical protein